MAEYQRTVYEFSQMLCAEGYKIQHAAKVHTSIEIKKQNTSINLNWHA